MWKHYDYKLMFIFQNMNGELARVDEYYVCAWYLCKLLYITIIYHSCYARDIKRIHIKTICNLYDTSYIIVSNISCKYLCKKYIC